MGTHPIFESDFDCLTESDDSFFSPVCKYQRPSRWLVKWKCWRAIQWCPLRYRYSPRCRITGKSSRRAKRRITRRISTVPKAPTSHPIFATNPLQINTQEGTTTKSFPQRERKTTTHSRTSNVSHKRLSSAHLPMFGSGFWIIGTHSLNWPITIQIRVSEYDSYYTF